jgi:ketosteroid isomerase-like protein
VRAGARFELVELNVIAGHDVACAWALLRCGSDDELQLAPSRRLRLTFGLRRDEDGWRVTHEHHSFTHRCDG